MKYGILQLAILKLKQNLNVNKFHFYKRNYKITILQYYNNITDKITIQ